MIFNISEFRSKPLRKKKNQNFEPNHLRFLTIFYEQRGGLTDRELAPLANSAETRARWAREILVKFGLVENTNKKRKTPSGKNASVWRITLAGINKYREQQGEKE